MSFISFIFLDKNNKNERISNNHRFWPEWATVTAYPPKWQARVAFLKCDIHFLEFFCTINMKIYSWPDNVQEEQKHYMTKLHNIFVFWSIRINIKQQSFVLARWICFYRTALFNKPINTTKLRNIHDDIQSRNRPIYFHNMCFLRRG